MLLVDTIIEAMEGKSVQDVAKAAGISRQYLYKVLAGEHDPTSAIAERLLAVLGKKIEVLTKQ